LTVVVLIAHSPFGAERRVSARCSTLVVWFAVIAVLGVRLVEEPAVLVPIRSRLRFFVDSRWLGFLHRLVF
jgi:hypothetical protein